MDPTPASPEGPKVYGGFVKLHRSWFDHPLFTEWPAPYFRLFTLILSSANWKPGVLRDGTVIPPGSLVTSVDKLSKEARVTTDQARSTIKSLTEAKIITYKTTNKYSVLTLLNWDTYSGSVDTESQTESQTDPPFDPKQNPKQNPNRGKKYKKNKEGEKGEEQYLGPEKRPGREAPAPPPPIAQLIAELIRNHPNGGSIARAHVEAHAAYERDRVGVELSVEQWCSDVRAMHEKHCSVWAADSGVRCPELQYWFQDGKHLQQLRPKKARLSALFEEEPELPRVEAEEQRTQDAPNQNASIWPTEINCRMCAGEGWKYPDHFDIPVGLSDDEFDRRIEEAKITCQQCGGTGKEQSMKTRSFNVAATEAATTKVEGTPDGR